MPDVEVYVPLSEYVPADLWPSDLFAADDGNFLDKIAYEDGIISGEDDSIYANVALRVMTETTFQLPAGFAFVLGHGPVKAELQVSAEGSQVTVQASVLKLRLPRSLFVPVVEEDDELKPDPDQTHFVDIPLPLTLTVEQDFIVDQSLNIDLIWPGETEGTLTLPRCMLGESGIIISAENIVLRLSDNQALPDAAAVAGLTDDWHGVFIQEAAIILPKGLGEAVPSDLKFQNCFIGTGGFSGEVSAGWDPAFSGTLLGITFGLKHFALTFKQNSVTQSDIRGTIALPFFDEPLDVEIAIDLAGGFLVKLDRPSGLLNLTKSGVLELELESIGFSFVDGLFTATISGQVKPLFGTPGLEWPTFKVRELTIDSEGHVHLEGGWLDLPNQYVLDFHGFQIEITKLGFGKNENGGKWIGFSGGLKLVEGFTAGASVEGLRITWYDDGRSPGITLNGVGVEFEVPEVVRFKGAVSYRELPGDVHRFDGSITLELISLGLEIDAVLVVGSAPGYTFFAIYLGVELPAGIPLWSTGLGLYGMAGLFALNMEPDKHSDEEWYGIGPTDGWYHRDTVGVTDLAAKWVNRGGSLALGGGITIGTVVDNGFTFSGKVLLVIVFPGPIILIEGKANLLRERSSLGDEPIFRALAVLDFRAGTFLIGLDAQYMFGGGGELIDIRGGAEAYFSFSDAGAWHLYLGIKDPREKRIRAQFIQIFEANAYFMLNSHQLAMGAWIGYAKHWTFGPLSVTVEAWIEGNAVVSWKPVYLHGDLWLHGKAELKVFGFGLGLSVDAKFAADVFDPFHVLASFGVGISLPWPLPDFDVTITLEWGPTPVKPPLPLPLKEIAVEHFKVTTSWPLPRGGGQALLLPNYDIDADGFLNRDGNGNPQPPVPAVATQEAAVPPANLPVVPLDARPHLTFGRSVHDLASIGVNVQPVTPEYERIGDPALNEGPVNVKYSLAEVALHKYDGGTWTPVARKATTPNPAGVPTLYGSWAPIPATPDGGGENLGQVKLWLWSKTPFDYTRHSVRSWDEWFTDRFENYPCLPVPPDREECCDFERLDPALQFASPWRCPGDRRFTISWLAPTMQSATVLPRPIVGLTHALCFPAAVPGVFTPVVPNVVTVTPPEPTKKVRLLVTGVQTTPDRACVGFQGFRTSQGPNPRTEQNVTFLVRDRNGNPQPVTRIEERQTTSGPIGGLDCGFTLEITLPCAATWVSVTLTRGAAPATVEAFNEDGGSVGTVQMQGPQGMPETLALTGNAMTRIVVTSPQHEMLLHEVCYICPTATGVDVQATGFDSANTTYGPFTPQNGVIEVDGTDMTRVEVRSPRGFCLVQVCVTLAPSAAELAEREAMMQHMRDELARWSQTGDVLQPHTSYRIKVVTRIETTDDPIGDFEQTEFAYFRTEGPPGLTALSVPLGAQNPNEFKSGLEDLTRYVRQTVPATVPGPGEKPPLPRPVYRGYDVGVEFNEDYVDLMYRLEGRDLGLYLYNSNNQAVRDAQGRLTVLTNQWGRTEDLTLTQSDNLWITVVNASDCGSLDTAVIPHRNTLTAAQGQVLNADTVYEARLIPLLLHEAFSGYTLGATADGPSGRIGRWLVRDEGGNSGPSHWQIGEDGAPPSRYILQTSNIWGGTTLGADPVKPGTLLLYDDEPALAGSDPIQPANWTDYRFSVTLRSVDDDAIGMVFRYLNANNYYRFSMDRERRYRRLVRVVGGITTVLADDDFVYLQDNDYLITVEAIGASLRVYQDRALVFDVMDASMDHGRIGLYCWAAEGARFSDVRVDDFRAAAPVVYRFSFTTSQFVDFFHQLHSFQDETWRVTLPAGADIAPEVAQAVAPSLPPMPPADAEVRAYDSLAAKALGQAAQQNPPEVQIMRVEQGGDALAFLIQSPEPMDWRRTQMTFSRADRQAPAPTPPQAVKLTDVTFGATQPNEESVALLLREAADLTGYRIESRQMPGPIAEPGGNPILFADDFAGRDAGLLFQEAFGPNALDHYTIVDEGTALGPSAWAVSGGQIVQSSNIYGGGVSGNVPDKPGTIALTGAPDWDNVRIRATLRSDDNDAIGLVFRYQDANNYYRFSMDSQRSYRRLIKKVNGTVSVLWEDGVAYNVGQAYRVELIAAGDQLLGYLNDALLFSVRDDDVQTGRVGLYCWLNTGAQFQTLTVESVEGAVVLWQPAFADLSDVRIEDEAGAINGPSTWAVGGGVLTQSSGIHVVDATPLQPGTYALGGSPDWRDVQISVQLRSDTDQAIGVMFRYRDADHYYRFSMDASTGYRRLIKNVAGVVTVLWQDGVRYTVGQSYELTLRTVGSELTGVLGGTTLFTINDSDLKRGQVGLYCRNNSGARFERVVVTDAARRVSGWFIRDEGTVSVPSVWRRSGDALTQSGGIAGGVAPDLPGTAATAGDPTWGDYRLTVQLRSDTDQGIGVVFRYQDTDHYYRFSMDRARSYRRLIKKVGGVVTTLWEDAGGYAVGTDLTLTIDAIGSRLVGYQGSARLFTIPDGDLPAGQVGLYAWGNTGARFERVEVREPPLEAYALFRDRFASGDTSDWTFVDEGTINAPSAWAALQGTLRQSNNIYAPPDDRDTLSKLGTQAVAGDPTWGDVIVSVRLQAMQDDTLGLLFRYQDVSHYYRFSMDSQRGYRRLVKNVGGAFTRLWEDGVSYEVGRVYELTIVAIGGTLRGYLDGVPLFVVEDGDISTGRIGLYTWGTTDARFSQVRVYPATQAFGDWLLDDPFDVLNPALWTFVDEGDQNAPSQWAVMNGELRQTSNIHGGNAAANAPDKPGTYALAGDVSWTDYRVSVRLTSATDQAIGVMFRYQDADHYYRFSMDRSRSYRRLIKKVGALVTMLWEDAAQFAVGREYVLTLDCLGERLMGYLDGVPLFSVEDGSIGGGEIGLYCWSNTGVSFGEVRVAAPVWTTHYAFGHEERLSAGTRLRVFSGNLADMPAAEPGILYRFVALLAERGQLHLSAAMGADLRVVAPRQTSGHSRRFPPDSAFAVVPERVLRKVDGTGLVVIVPAGNPAGTHLDAGQYRVRLIYLRDNRAADPVSQVFREAGNSTPEVVMLDIPWQAH